MKPRLAPPFLAVALAIIAGTWATLLVAATAAAGDVPCGTVAIHPRHAFAAVSSDADATPTSIDLAVASPEAGEGCPALSSPQLPGTVRGMSVESDASLADGSVGTRVSFLTGQTPVDASGRGRSLTVPIESCRVSSATSPPSCTAAFAGVAPLRNATMLKPSVDTSAGGDRTIANTERHAALTLVPVLSLVRGHQALQTRSADALGRPTQHKAIAGGALHVSPNRSYAVATSSASQSPHTVETTVESSTVSAVSDVQVAVRRVERATSSAATASSTLEVAYDASRATPDRPLREVRSDGISVLIQSDSLGRPIRRVEAIAASAIGHTEVELTYASTSSTSSSFSDHPASGAVNGIPLLYNAAASGTQTSTRLFGNASAPDAIRTHIAWCAKTHPRQVRVPCEVEHRHAGGNRTVLARFTYSWSWMAGSKPTLATSTEAIGTTVERSCNFTHAWQADGELRLAAAACVPTGTSAMDAATADLWRVDVAYAYDNAGRLRLVEDRVGGISHETSYSTRGVPSKVTTRIASTSPAASNGRSALYETSESYRGAAMNSRVDRSVAAVFEFEGAGPAGDKLRGVETAHALTSRALESIAYERDALGRLKRRSSVAQSATVVTSENLRNTLANVSFVVNPVGRRAQLRSANRDDGTPVFAATAGPRGEDLMAWTSEHGHVAVLSDAFGPRALVALSGPRLGTVVEAFAKLPPTAVSPPTQPATELSPAARLLSTRSPTSACGAFIDTIGDATAAESTVLVDLCTGVASFAATGRRLALEPVPDSVEGASLTATVLRGPVTPEATRSLVASEQYVGFDADASALFWAAPDDQMDEATDAITAHVEALRTGHARSDAAPPLRPKRSAASSPTPAQRVLLPQARAALRAVSNTAASRAPERAALAAIEALSLLTSTDVDGSTALESVAAAALRDFVQEATATSTIADATTHITAPGHSRAASITFDDIVSACSGCVFVDRDPRALRRIAIDNATGDVFLVASAASSTTTPSQQHFADALRWTLQAVTLQHQPHALPIGPAITVFDGPCTTAGVAGITSTCTATQHVHEDEVLSEDATTIPAPAVVAHASRIDTTPFSRLAELVFGAATGADDRLQTVVTPLTSRLAAAVANMPVSAETRLNEISSIGCGPGARYTIRLVRAAGTLPAKVAEGFTVSDDISTVPQLTAVCEATLEGERAVSSALITFCAELNAAVAVPSSPSLRNALGTADAAGVDGLLMGVAVAEWVFAHSGATIDVAALGLGLSPESSASAGASGARTVAEWGGAPQHNASVTERNRQAASGAACRNVTVDVAVDLRVAVPAALQETTAPVLTSAEVTLPTDVAQVLQRMSLSRANATLGPLGVVETGMSFSVGALPLSLPTAPVSAGVRAVPGPAVDLRADVSDPLSTPLVVRRHAVGNVAMPTVEPAQLYFGRAQSLGDGSRSTVVYDHIVLAGFDSLAAFNGLPTISASAALRSHSGTAFPPSVRFETSTEQVDLTSHGVVNVYRPVAGPRDVHPATDALRLVQFRNGTSALTTRGFAGLAAAPSPIATFDSAGLAASWTAVSERTGKSCGLRVSRSAQRRIATLQNDCGVPDVAVTYQMCESATVNATVLRTACVATSASCAEYAYTNGCQIATVTAPQQPDGHRRWWSFTGYPTPSSRVPTSVQWQTSRLDGPSNKTTFIVSGLPDSWGMPRSTELASASSGSIGVVTEEAAMANATTGNNDTATERIVTRRVANQLYGVARALPKTTQQHADGALASLVYDAQGGSTATWHFANATTNEFAECTGVVGVEHAATTTGGAWAIARDLTCAATRVDSNGTRVSSVVDLRTGRILSHAEWDVDGHVTAAGFAGASPAPSPLLDQLLRRDQLRLDTLPLDSTVARVDAERDAHGRPSLLRWAFADASVSSSSAATAPRGMALDYDQQPASTTVRGFHCDAVVMLRDGDAAASSQQACASLNAAAVPIFAATLAVDTTDGSVCVTPEAAVHGASLGAVRVCLSPGDMRQIRRVTRSDDPAFSVATIARDDLDFTAAVTSATVRDRVTGATLFPGGEEVRQSATVLTVHSATLSHIATTVRIGASESVWVIAAQRSAALGATTFTSVVNTTILSSASEPTAARVTNATQHTCVATVEHNATTAAGWRATFFAPERVPLQLLAGGGIIRRQLEPVPAPALPTGSDGGDDAPVPTTTPAPTTPSGSSDFVFPTSLDLAFHDLSKADSRTFTLFVTMKDPPSDGVWFSSLSVNMPDGCVLQQTVYPQNEGDRQIRVLGECWLYGPVPFGSAVRVTTRWSDGQYDETQAVAVSGYGYVDLSSAPVALAFESASRVRIDASQRVPADVGATLRQVEANSAVRFVEVALVSDQSPSSIVVSRAVTDAAAELFNESAVVAFDSVPIDESAVSTLGVALIATRQGDRILPLQATVGWSSVANAPVGTTNSTDNGNGVPLSAVDALLSAVSPTVASTLLGIPFDTTTWAVVDAVAASASTAAVLVRSRDGRQMVLRTPSWTTVVSDVVGTSACTFVDGAVAFSASQQRYVVVLAATCNDLRFQSGKGLIVRPVVAATGAAPEFELYTIADAELPTVRVTSGNVAAIHCRSAIATAAGADVLVRTVSITPLQYRADARIAANLATVSTLTTVSNASATDVVVVSASSLNTTHVALRAMNPATMAATQGVSPSVVAKASNAAALLRATAAPSAGAASSSVELALVFAASAGQPATSVVSVHTVALSPTGSNASFVGVSFAVPSAVAASVTMCPGSHAASLRVVAVSPRGVVQIARSSTTLDALSGTPSVFHSSTAVSAAPIAVSSEATRTTIFGTDHTLLSRVVCRADGDAATTIIASLDATGSTASVTAARIAWAQPRLNATALPDSITVPFPPSPIAFAVSSGASSSGRLAVGIDRSSLPANFVVATSTSNPSAFTVTTSAAGCGCASMQLITNAGESAAVRICSFGACAQEASIAHTPPAVDDDASVSSAAVPATALSRAGGAFVVSTRLNNDIQWASAAFVFRNGNEETPAKAHQARRSSASTAVNTTANTTYTDLDFAATSVPTAADGYCSSIEWTLQLRDTAGRAVLTFGPFSFRRAEPPSPMLGGRVDGGDILLRFRDVSQHGASSLCLTSDTIIALYCYPAPFNQVTRLSLRASAVVTFQAYVVTDGCNSAVAPPRVFSTIVGVPGPLRSAPEIQSLFEPVALMSLLGLASVPVPAPVVTTTTAVPATTTTAIPSNTNQVNASTIAPPPPPTTTALATTPPPTPIPEAPVEVLRHSRVVVSVTGCEFGESVGLGYTTGSPALAVPLAARAICPVGSGSSLRIAIAVPTNVAGLNITAVRIRGPNAVSSPLTGWNASRKVVDVALSSPASPLPPLSLVSARCVEQGGGAPAVLGMWVTTGSTATLLSDEAVRPVFAVDGEVPLLAAPAWQTATNDTVPSVRLPSLCGSATDVFAADAIRRVACARVGLAVTRTNDADAAAASTSGSTGGMSGFTWCRQSNRTVATVPPASVDVVNASCVAVNVPERPTPGSVIAIVLRVPLKDTLSVHPRLLEGVSAPRVTWSGDGVASRNSTLHVPRDVISAAAIAGATEISVDALETTVAAVLGTNKPGDDAYDAATDSAVVSLEASLVTESLAQPFVALCGATVRVYYAGITPAPPTPAPPTPAPPTTTAAPPPTATTATTPPPTSTTTTVVATTSTGGPTTPAPTDGQGSTLVPATTLDPATTATASATAAPATTTGFVNTLTPTTSDAPTTTTTPTAGPVVSDTPDVGNTTTVSVDPNATIVAETTTALTSTGTTAPLTTASPDVTSFSVTFPGDWSEAYGTASVENQTTIRLSIFYDVVDRLQMQREDLLITRVALGSLIVGMTTLDAPRTLAEITAALVDGTEFSNTAGLLRAWGFSLPVIASAISTGPLPTTTTTTTPSNEPTATTAFVTETLAPNATNVTMNATGTPFFTTNGTLSEEPTTTGVAPVDTTTAAAAVLPEAPADDDDDSVLSMWWFWLAVVAGIAVIIFIVVLVVRSRSKKSHDDELAAARERAIAASQGRPAGGAAPGTDAPRPGGRGNLPQPVQLHQQPSSQAETPTIGTPGAQHPSFAYSPTLPPAEQLRARQHQLQREEDERNAAAAADAARRQEAEERHQRFLRLQQQMQPPPAAAEAAVAPSPPQSPPRPLAAPSSTQPSLFDAPATSSGGGPRFDTGDNDEASANATPSPPVRPAFNLFAGPGGSRSPAAAAATSRDAEPQLSSSSDDEAPRPPSPPLARLHTVPPKLGSGAGSSPAHTPQASGSYGSRPTNEPAPDLFSNSPSSQQHAQAPVLFGSSTFDDDAGEAPRQPTFGSLSPQRQRQPALSATPSSAGVSAAGLSAPTSPGPAVAVGTLVTPPAAAVRAQPAAPPTTSPFSSASPPAATTATTNPAAAGATSSVRPSAGARFMVDDSSSGDDGAEQGAGPSPIQPTRHPHRHHDPSPHSRATPGPADDDDDGADQHSTTSPDDPHGHTLTHRDDHDASSMPVSGSPSKPAFPAFGSRSGAGPLDAPAESTPPPLQASSDRQRTTDPFGMSAERQHTTGATSMNFSGSSRRKSIMGDDLRTEALLDGNDSPPMSPSGVLSGDYGSGVDQHSVSLGPDVFVRQPQNNAISNVPRPLETPAPERSTATEVPALPPMAEASPPTAAAAADPSAAAEPPLTATVVVTEALEYSSAPGTSPPTASIVGQLTVVFAAAASARQSFDPARRSLRLSADGPAAHHVMRHLQLHPSVTGGPRDAGSVVMGIQVPALAPGASSRSVVARYVLPSDEGALESLPMQLSAQLHRVPAAPAAEGTFATLVTVRFTWSPATEGHRQSSMLRLPLPPPAPGDVDADGERQLLLRPAAGSGVTSAADGEVTWTLARGGEDLLPDGPTNPLAAKFTSTERCVADPGEEDTSQLAPLAVHASVGISGGIFTGTAIAVAPIDDDGGEEALAIKPPVHMARTTKFTVYAQQPTD